LVPGWFRIGSEGFVRVCFGNCIADFDTRELSRAGKPAHVEPRALKLLELLIAARPKALSKSELQDALWPKTYVSERSLARLAADLRRALGDKAKKSRFIRTVHRFGYAFSAEATTAPKPRKSDFHCRVLWGEREVALLEGENVLGRDPSVAVWIDLNSVSRRHARIVVSDGRATLEDLGSKNGTFVQGRKVTSPVRLGNGDPIKIGEARLTFRCFGKVGTTESEVRGDPK